MPSLLMKFKTPPTLDEIKALGAAAPEGAHVMVWDDSLTVEVSHASEDDLTVFAEAIARRQTQSQEGE